MSIARKDERYTEELVDQISDAFSRSLTAKKTTEGEDSAPGLVIKGDARDTPKPKRRDR